MSSPANGQFSKHDRIVAVMGRTGAGKSTFIDYATRQNGKYVGHNWESSTSEIQPVRATHPTDCHSVVFIDTPGLDHTYMSDEQILGMIADWLIETYNKDVNLTTILYLHKISDNRMSRAAMKNLRLFSSLCGQQAMPNVVIVTTMWNMVEVDLATKREEGLIQGVWKDMLKNGCKIKRFKDTYESAWDIVGNVLQKHSEPVSIVTEMVNGKSVLETEAGKNCNDRYEVPKGLLKKIRRRFSKWIGWIG